MNKGIIRVSGHLWNDKKFRRVFLKHFKVLKKDEELEYDIYILKCESRWFDVKVDEGVKIPEYYPTFINVKKKFLFWQWDKMMVKKVL